MSASSKKKRTPTFTERLYGAFWQRGVLSVVVIALVVFLALAATFWFVVFSGASSSADLIYSQF